MEKQQRKQDLIREAMDDLKANKAQLDSAPHMGKYTAMIAARSGNIITGDDAYSRRVALARDLQTETADEAFSRRAAISRLALPTHDTQIRKSRFDEPPSESPMNNTCKILIEGAIKTLKPSQEELRLLQKDMVTQCMKYGNVIDFLLIDQDIQMTFKTPEQALRAQRKLNQRTFDGSTILCSLI